MWMSLWRSSARRSDLPIVIHLKRTAERSQAGIVRAMNENFQRVSVTSLGFVQELAGEVAQQRAHAQSPHLFSLVYRMRNAVSKTPCTCDMVRASHTLRTIQ